MKTAAWARRVAILAALLGPGLGQAPWAQDADTGAAAPAAPGWNLSELYSTPEAWQSAYDQVRSDAMRLDRLRGTLGRDAPALFQALTAISDVRRQAARLSAYASLRGDEDLAIGVNQERVQRAQGLRSLIDQKTAWLGPEVREIGAERVNAWLAADAAAARRFDFMLHDLLRRAPHILDAEGEALLAGASQVFRQPERLHAQLANAELPFPTVRLSATEPVRLDSQGYTHWRAVASREERKQVFDAFWGAWKTHQATMGANLTTQVDAEVYLARARHFDTALDAALDGSNMPPAVYRTLMAQANAGLPTLHRYLRLRQRLLGVPDELGYYDSYVSLFPVPANLRFSLQDSEQIVLDALAPLGEDYLALLRRGFAGDWMNPYPHPGKASGAYMNGYAYDVHPYVLLNHQQDFDSLSTLAHEWGHAVHSLLANRSQPFEKADYSTFIAESASIGNELLLSDYLIAHARTRAEKLYFLGQQLESIRTEFFRQAMIAEFQLAIHEEVEHDHPLTGERMTQLYCTLLRHYYGEAEGVMKIDPLYCTEWEYFAHLYYGFYVWQYATSMAGAAELTDAVVHEGAAARGRFLSLLSAGGSDDPYTLYLRAGVDMAKPQPYQALVARMDRAIDQIERLLAAQQTER